MTDLAVLYVDDDADIRTIVSLALSLDPTIALRVATSGAEALEVVTAGFVPDVALLDIMMPGMDGYETMRAIRAQSSFRSLPLIAVTAKAMKGDREKCLEAGATDYVSKPIDMDQLLAVLRVQLARRGEVINGAAPVRGAAQDLERQTQ